MKMSISWTWLLAGENLYSSNNIITQCKFIIGLSDKFQPSIVLHPIQRRVSLFMLKIQ